ITACRTHVFTWVARGNNTAGSLAKVTGLEKDEAAYLLEAMVSMELLVVNQQGEYFNTELAGLYLDLDSPHYVGEMFSQFALEHIKLGDRETPPQVGSPGGAADIDEATLRPRDTPVIQGTAIHGLSSASSMAFARFYDFSGNKHLLDIAGGIAATAISAALRNPGLKVTVFDKATVNDLGKAYTNSVGLGDRIDFAEGEIFLSEYPAGPDIHFCGNTLHGFTEEHCRVVMRKSFHSLPAGGTLVFHDRVMEHDSPPYSPILNAGTLMLDRHGLIHAVEDYKQWMIDSGFNGVRVSTIAGIPGFVIGQK
ncbi:MAG: methyltransferase, partial [Betaproteobacteria bacterium]